MMATISSPSVWKFYEKVPKTTNARCILCNKEYSYKTSITNLKKHLHYKHKNAFQTVMLESKKRAITAPVKIKAENRKAPGNKSAVWLHYDKLSDQVARCKICKKQYSYKTSVTNLKKHLGFKHKHLSEYLDEVKPATVATENRQLSIKEQLVEDCFCEPETDHSTVIETDPPSPPSPPRLQQHTSSHVVVKKYQNHKQFIDSELLEMIIQDYLPFSIVEDKGFRDFVEALNPNYELPDRKVISGTLIPNQYLDCKRQMMELVQNAKNVCITMDCWTSVLKDEYVAITAHFNIDYELKSVLLHCEHISSSQTVDELAETLKTIASEWNISDKITLAVSGNELVMNAILKIGWPIFGCFLHKLNAIIDNAMKLIGFVLEKVKFIVTHFKKCNSSREELRMYQINFEKKLQALQLIQSNEINWNSDFYMLERFLKLQGSLEAVIPNLDVILPDISIEMWDAIRQVCIILKPFEEVTRIMSANHYLPGSLAIVIVDGLKNAIEHMKSKLFFGVAKDFLENIEQGLNNYFPESEIEENILLAACTFLDPRFKIHAFLDENQSAAEVSADEGSSRRTLLAYSIKQHVLELIKTKLKEKREKGNNHSIVVIDSNDQPDSYKSTTAGNIEFVTVEDDIEFVSVWGKFDKTIESITPSADDIATNAENELNMFLNEDMLQRESSPLVWWKFHNYIYPNLAEIFKEHCVVVVTSVECGKAFSKAGIIETDKRSRLSRKHTAELVFLKNNEVYCK